MNGASQHQPSKDVKEDLKKIFLSTSQKYHSILIVREQQIYGLNRIFGNNAVTLPVRMDENNNVDDHIGSSGRTNP